MKEKLTPQQVFAKTKAEYLSSLKRLKDNAPEPMIVKPTVGKEQAISAVEKIVNGEGRDGAIHNKKLLEMIKKKGCKPTVKCLYFNVPASYFTVDEVEYDYNYYYNGNCVNMSAKRITINEGYGDFSTFTQCFAGADEKKYTGEFCPAYNWDEVTEDMLAEDFEEGWEAVYLTQSDIDAESKNSMKQLNAKLKEWLKDYIQQQLGKARTLDGVTIYDKHYEYSEHILLAPYLLVTYDLGDLLVTVPVNGVTGKAGETLLNNPIASVSLKSDVVPPSFSVVIFLLLSVVIVVFGGVFYLLNYLLKKATYKKKSLNGYTLDELRRFL